MDQLSLPAILEQTARFAYTMSTVYCFVGGSERLAGTSDTGFSEQETAERLGENARSLAEEELTVERMTEKYLTEYIYIISDRT